MQPLVSLMDDAPPPPGSLPAPLAERYGGGLHLADDLVFANYITTLDGVATLGRANGSVEAIGQGDAADHFVMGLLRAHADCILVGAATARIGPGRSWTAASIHPASAPLYALLRRPDPRFAVVTSTGEVDVSRPPISERGLILTGSAGAARLRGIPVPVRHLGEPPFSGARVIQALRAEGMRRILVEAGPTLMGRLLDDRVLDELFLTLAPRVAGRDGADGRTGLAEGVHLLPARADTARLRSVRTAGSLLFLRYAL
jgi:riboflavin biosynthesis pyrimidine reductase